MENNNLLVAVLLSICVLVGFHYAYEVPHQQAMREQILAQRLEKQGKTADSAEILASVRKDRASLVAETKRITIDTPELKGSINLKGARLDDLSLKNYKNSTDEKAAPIVLLSPAGTAAPDQPYYAEFGWLGEGEGAPTSTTEWTADTNNITPEHPAHLSWANGQGLIFDRTISVDNEFLFTITDRVKNTSDKEVVLFPFGLVARHGANASNDQEGPLGVFNGTLTEYKFKDMASEGKKVIESTGGWLGLGDKYWLVALVPQQTDKIAASFTYQAADDKDPLKGLFQTDFRSPAVTIAAGATTEKTTHLFAGAKRVRLFDTYAEKLQMIHFDRAIDFGWFYFLTKPFLYLLDFLGSICGNYGFAILILTVLLKGVTYPLSAKSYRSMAKMKDLQPEIQHLQERYKDDQQRLAVETMALYKREKTNPMSGCLPMLVQIPIFFALYKVLSVNIELRHAPFYGWIKDLAAPDPTSIWNLFGMIPYHIDFLPALGVWPLLMGISMYVQQALSPQPPDANQARMFKFMPILFTFMMAQAASGLVIYWTLGNVLGLLQQWAIMRNHGPQTKESQSMTDPEIARKLFAQPCTFVLAATEPAHFPQTPLNEVAFIGRSNVGKSSVINGLTNRKDLARTSNTPGRTQQILFFNLADRLMLVDLPGYGHSIAPLDAMKQWNNLVRCYLQKHAALRLVCLLLDARHGPLAKDLEMMEFLDKNGIGYQVILTKEDQLRSSERDERKTQTTELLARHGAARPSIFMTSAAKKTGFEELRQNLADFAV